MQIGLLGPLEVRDAAGTLVEVAGGRLRTLLARLAVDAGRFVAVSELADAVWGGRLPAEPANALQTLVSRLRRALGDPSLVVAAAAGYRLAVDAGDVDASAFRRGVGAAAALLDSDPARAAALLREALDLWRGPALVDTGTDGSAFDALTTYAEQLERLRVSATSDRVGAELALVLEGGGSGTGSDGMSLGVLVAELEVLRTDHPLDERIAALSMRALAAAGRQADALRGYEALRARLAEDLGVDPGPDLQRLHVAVLRGELDRPVRAVAEPSRRRTNLKAQLTSFVGREADVARIGKLLEQQRLVTLVGPGGAGKTRLATEVAARMADVAADGVWLVELAPVTAAGDIAHAVLAALGLRETQLLDRRPATGATDPLTRLGEVLADRRVLVVLDNCEHLVDGSAQLADQLLARCHDLRVLATSREPLAIIGETLVAVAPLGQPAAGTGPEDALEYPAVRLFADRAVAARADFRVDHESVADVIEIVRRLDGLPLAIELAAARTRSLALPDIAARLSDRFRLLNGGSRTALPRHRTLRAVVEWSWDLLAPPERSLAERLAVFVSGMTAAGAAAVSDEPADVVTDLLSSLVDKSLLQPVGDGRRFRMLETIREFGLERLAELGEVQEVRARHAGYFAGLLRDAEPHLTTADQLPWFQLLTSERDEIVAALRFRCDTGDADVAVRMGISLAEYSMMLGDHADLSDWLGDALAVPGGTDDDLRLVARTLCVLNSSAMGRGNDDPGGPAATLGELAAQLENVRLPDSPLFWLLRPAAAFFGGDVELTQRYLDDSIANGGPWAAAAAHTLQASFAENAGDVDTMRVHTDIALREFEALGERWGMSTALRNLGQLRLLDGDVDGAGRAYEEALRISSELGSHDDTGFVLLRLAEIALRSGDPDAARRYLHRADVSTHADAPGMEAVYSTAMLGAIEYRLGNIDEALRLVDDATRRLATMPRGHPAMGQLRAMVQTIAARVAVDEDDLPGATEHARVAFASAIGTTDMPIVAGVGIVVAQIAAAAGSPEQAATMLGAATRIRGAADPTSIDIIELTARLRVDLGDAGFEVAHARGMALDRDAAIECLSPESYARRL